MTPLASTPPPARRRWLSGRARIALARVAKFTAAVAGLVGAVAAGRLANEYVRTSAAFAVDTILVEGHDRLDEHGVTQAAGLELGMNAFAMAPEDARARLERHPWIASATVERRLPGTFKVAIAEHRPAFSVALGDELYLVDDEGRVFKAATPDDPVDLPVVTGIDRARFARDRGWRTEVLAEVASALADWRAAGLWRREPVSELHLERTEEWVAYAGDDGMLVRLGRGPFLSKLRQLRRVLDRLEPEQARPRYVHLDNVRRPDRVVVRLEEEQ